MQRLRGLAYGGLLVLVGVQFALAQRVRVKYTEPSPAGSMPTFGSVPFPNNLYFDGGGVAAGDGTLINKDPANPDGFQDFGIKDSVLPAEERAVLAGLDRLDGFGVTTPVWFFFDGPLKESSLPGEPVANNGRVNATPSAADSVFLVEVGSSPPRFVPVKFHVDFDTRIPNTLAVVPLVGEVLKPNTQYAAVVTSRLKSANGKPVESTADFEAAKSGPNFSAALAYVTGTLGVASAKVVGMAAFTTQTTAATLRDIRTQIIDHCQTTVDFGGGTFTSSKFFGAGVAPSVGLVGSGFYRSPRLQTLDPTDHSHRDGSGGAAEDDLPVGTTAEIDDEQFQDLGSNGGGCDLTTGSVPDGLPDVVDVDPSTASVLDLAQVPVSVAVPAGSPPPSGWPVIILQHGLGGDRSTALSLAEQAAAQGFAVVGIDAVDHGLRWDETDNIFNFTNAPGADGLSDGDLSNAVNLGFFEGFSSIAAIRDNFRQTYVDLMQLVHILSTGGFDSALSTDLDPNNIFYIGLSLGGLMGSGLTPYVPEVQAVVLDAAGGNLSSELFLNSTIGSGALPLIQAIFQLDPANPIGDFSFFSALSQSVLDAGDGTANASHWIKDPFPTPFRPMNVLLLEDMNDQVVPNQANEALAVAAGLEIFDPHVQNLVATTRPLPLAPTQGFIDGNVAGAVTAGLFQVGPGAHAVIEEGVATLSLVPGFALIDEFRNADVATAFVPLIRQLRIKHPGVLDDIFAWFRDIVNNGPPGRFAYTGAPLAFNSYQNQIIGKKKNTYIFFNRLVNADGTAPSAEPVPQVAIEIAGNKTVGRMTVIRSTLGATSDAADGDMPPQTTTATAKVLPFFVGIQRPDAPAYQGRNLTIQYTAGELAASGCAEADLFVARFNDFNGRYDALPSAVDTAQKTVRVTGLQGADGVYGVFCSTSAVPFNQHLTGRSLTLKFPKKPQAPRSLVIQASIIDPTSTVTIDPTTTDIAVTVWEDRDNVLFSQTLIKDCWVNKKPGEKWIWKTSTCGGGDPGVFTRGLLKKTAGTGGTTFKFVLKAKGDLGFATTTLGGGGAQVELGIAGETYNTSGGKCRRGNTSIACSKYD